MENTEEAPNLKIELNNTNSAYPSNSNMPINNKNVQKEDYSSNNKLKIGQYILTPLECLLLNKKMPRGFKFEIENNILKQLEPTKIQPKKMKGSGAHVEHQKHVKLIKNQKNEDNSSNINKNHSSNNLNGNKKTKKTVSKENSSNLSSKLSKAPSKNHGGTNHNNKNENNINNNSESYKTMMKCQSGFNKILSNPNSKHFYSSKTPNTPSLSNIEKKIKNYEYKTINDFCDDLRKLWNYQFKNYAKDPNIYQNICKLSFLSDQICKELSNENINENKIEEFSNIKKRTEKIKKELEEIKTNNNNYNNNNYNHNEAYNNKNNRQKNMEDIYNLGRLIRSLNKPQLKGIVTVISDNNEYQNSSTFEFDLEQLSPEKYKKLKEYVINCLSKEKKHRNNNLIKKNTFIGLDKEISQAKNNNNNISTNLKNNKNMVSNNNDLNPETNDKNNHNQFSKKEEEKMDISDKKSFSDSDSISSDSSLSN